MTMFNITPKVTKEYILKYLSEEEIFEYFLNVKVRSGNIFSPLRTEKTPSANFFIGRNGSLLLCDQGLGFLGDCFAAIQYKWKLSFSEALLKVKTDMLDARTLIHERVPTKPPLDIKHTKITIQSQDWTRADKEYWSAYYLNSKHLAKFYVYSCKFVFLNGVTFYRYSPEDPAYAYYFGNGEYKIYFPLRKEHRFISNTNRETMQGLHLLPSKGEDLIITKAYKDVICYDKYGLPAIAPSGESVHLSDSLITNLKSRFQNIYINYDFDRTGIISMNRERKKHGLIPLYFDKSWGTKDFAAYLKLNGEEKTQQLINNYKTLLNNK